MNPNELSENIVETIIKETIIKETYHESNRFQEYVNQDNRETTKFQASIRLIVCMISAEKMLERLNEDENEGVKGLLEIVKNTIIKSMSAGVIIVKK